MKKPPGGQFKTNDIVEFGGIRGVVASVSAPHEKLTLQVMFPNQKLIVGFFPDGRFLEWHTSSSLSFVRRGATIAQRIKSFFRRKNA